MNVPETSERRFYLVRKERDADGKEVLHPTDPYTGANINAEDQSTWMTADEVQGWKEFWTDQLAPPVVEYGLGFMREVPAAAPTVPVLRPSDIPKLTRHITTYNGKAQIEATLGNIRHALCEQTHVRIGFDQFHGRIMIAPSGTEAWIALTDSDMIRLRASLEGPNPMTGFAPISKDLMRDALQLVAERHTFDSAITWLNGLEWDGLPRITQFFSTHCGAVDDEYTRAVGNYMWTGLAGRVLEPGCQLDMVIAMQSKQGTKKSTGMQLLAPFTECFTDGLSLHQDDDDFKRLLRGKVVVEIAELAGLSRADINVVKRTITRRKEEWIEKWQTQPTTYPRRCMLFASTNEERFLPPDETGQRRWLPLQIAELNRELIVEDRLQLWAEGAYAWRECGILYARAEELAVGRHQKHEAGDVWETKIEQWLVKPPSTGEGPRPCERPLTIADVLQGAILMTPERMDARAEKRAQRVLRGLGYEPRTVRIDGRPCKRWVSAAVPSPPTGNL